MLAFNSWKTPRMTQKKFALAVYAKPEEPTLAGTVQPGVMPHCVLSGRADYRAS